MTHQVTTKKLVKTLIVALFVTVGATFAFGQEWVPPANSALTQNVAAPIHAGLGNQEKSGSLSIWGPFLVDDRVHLGRLNPNSEIVVGKETTVSPTSGVAYAQALVNGPINVSDTMSISQGLVTGDHYAFSSSDQLPDGYSVVVEGDMVTHDTVLTKTLENQITQVKNAKLCAAQDGQIVLCSTEENLLNTIGISTQEQVAASPSYSCVREKYKFSAIVVGGSGNYQYTWKLCPLGNTNPSTSIPPAEGTNCQEVSNAEEFEREFGRITTNPSQPYSVEVQLRIEDLESGIVKNTAKSVTIDAVPESNPEC